MFRRIGIDKNNTRQTWSKYDRGIVSCGAFPPGGEKGLVGSNPSELERFRSKPSEPSPSLQGSGVPHSDAEARIEMGKSGNDASELGSDTQHDCSGKLLLHEYVVRDETERARQRGSRETQAIRGTLSGFSQPAEDWTVQNQPNTTTAPENTNDQNEKKTDW